MSAETNRIEPPEGSGWHLHSPYGAQRFKDGPDGYVVRLADVVRWLMQVRETSFANAVRAVCAPLEGDAPPPLYRLDAVEDAAPENDTTEWLKYLSGYEGLHSLPPQVANARAAALALKATWLMTPRELSRLVNSPGFSSEYDETKESPFEFSERTDRTGGPKDLAVPFAVAHALWGWGSVVAVGAAASAPLSLVRSEPAQPSTPVSAPAGKVPQKSQHPQWTGEALAAKRAALKREDPKRRDQTQQLATLSGLPIREITRREKQVRDAQQAGSRASGKAP